MHIRLAPLLLMTLASAPLAAAEASAETPNIVFILADDLGWMDLGCQGSKYYRTPNIDRLAAQGVRFTSAYTNGPNCAPTRAALLSGRQYPNNPVYTVGSDVRGAAADRKLIPVDNQTTLPLSHVTFAERLMAAGYATAHIGKWHLGTPGKSGPAEQGFALNIAGNHSGAPHSYFSPYRNPQLPDGPKGEHLTDRLTDEAIEFIEATRDRPFLLYLPHYAVHTPLQAPDAIVARYQSKPAVDGQGNATYAAMVESLDSSVGRILDTLDRTGLADRTVVVFISDNGGVGGYAADGGNITSNAPLRGGKGQLYEGGVRVPLIVRYPPIITAHAGATCDVPVVGIDFYPTLLGLCGLAPDADYKLDGVSILPLLRNPKAKLDREAIYWHFPGYLQSLRGKELWRTTPAGAIRAGDWKLIEFYEDKRVELYNVTDDIGETKDLSATNRDKAGELRDKLHAWRRSVDAPMPTPR